ncbi:MAG: (2Fe-2S)-binding protein [Aquificaceae bacterium]|nr:(2Fe-2S)-binding protein [Aquificaceae bacterium]MDW8294002.1 (2Fe-2S)-binding protein [Aquificaceae bacterium]
MDRRGFIKTCGTVAVASFIDPSLFSQVLAQQQDGMFQAYKKALLVKSDGTPLKEEDIKPQVNYIFFYPHNATPCYLINLGETVPPAEIKLKDGKSYRWMGGVGAKKSIVSYSAICAHQWSYPTPQYSFINYYPPDKPSETTKKAGIIQCCAHLALYDPKQGGSVIDGPADFPLASIVLQEEGGRFFATGVLGKDQFQQFFDNFRTELRQQYGSTAKARELVDKCIVMEVDKYVQAVVRC